ncbi:MAG: hypothetical protein FJ224_03150 [Lentisphaerae bacterium]|nr:hypothetical protein [Lentisphaerota bacterium]
MDSGVSVNRGKFTAMLPRNLILSACVLTVSAVVSGNGVLLAADSVAGRVVPGEEKSVEQLLAEVEAKKAEAAARADDTDRRIKEFEQKERLLREMARENSAKMLSLVHANSDSADAEVVALNRQIAEMEDQIKLLREKLQGRLEQNAEFVSSRLALQDANAEVMKARKDKGELMMAKAKITAELRELERERVALLLRREKERESIQATP